MDIKTIEIFVTSYDFLAVFEYLEFLLPFFSDFLGREVPIYGTYWLAGSLFSAVAWGSGLCILRIEEGFESSGRFVGRALS